MRRCGRCRNQKDESEFYMTKRGLHGYCKLCVGEHAKAWRIANAERNRERKNEWRLRNIEKERLREKVRSKKRYAENPEYHKAHRRTWEARNRDKKQAAARLWRFRNPRKVQDSWNRWAHNNPQVIRRRNIARYARKAKAFVEHVEPIVVWEKSNGHCFCGDPVSYYQMTVDHIVPLYRGGEHSYANTRAAHQDCNSAKRSKLDSELSWLT